MVLTKQQIERIKQVIDNYLNAFIFNNIGKDALSEEDLKKLKASGIDIKDAKDLFKDAFILGKYQGNVGTESSKTDNYKDFKNNISNVPLTEEDKYALEHIKQSTQQYVDNLKNKIKNKIVGEILANNKEAHYDKLGETIKPIFEQAIIDQKNVNELATDLRDKTQDVITDWNKIAKNELATAHNQGSLHAIVERNKNKDKKQILVFASGPLDASTCRSCKQFYHDGNSFKVYRLSELLANGTNYGKKQINWKPCVPPVHPHSIIDKETPVLTINGWEQIQNIKIGDLVLTHTGKFQKVIDSWNGKCEHKIYYKIYYKFENNQIMDVSLTSDHKLLTNNGWKEVKNIDCKTDKLVKVLQENKEYKFQDIEIENIKTIRTNKNTKIYDITVENDESFIIKGIVSHNCRHRLVELLPGWTLNENGQLEYVSPEYHELDNPTKS